MSIKNEPLVSCICVTHNSIEILRRSIRCFQSQTYNSKELIVAFASDNDLTANFLTELEDPSIKSLMLPAGSQITLGEKRNLAIDFASGFYFCVWDDDDWYSNRRIEFHVKSLCGTDFRSSALSNIILYDGKTNEAYLSATRWAWEQTLFCQKSVFENPVWRYKNLDRGEDSTLLYNLKQNNLLLTTFHPDLYIYVYHGRNAFHRGHWDVNLLPWAKKLSPDQSVVIGSIVDGKLSNQRASEILETYF